MPVPHPISRMRIPSGLIGAKNSFDSHPISRIWWNISRRSCSGSSLGKRYASINQHILSEFNNRSRKYHQCPQNDKHGTDDHVQTYSSDTSGERSCISRPCNISKVDNERGERGTFHHYCMPNRRHQSYVSVNIEAKSSSRVRTVGSTATVGAASASAASAGSQS